MTGANIRRDVNGRTRGHHHRLLLWKRGHVFWEATVPGRGEKTLIRTGKNGKGLAGYIMKPLTGTVCVFARTMHHER